MNLILIIVLLYIIGVILITTTLNIIQVTKNNKYKKMLDKLEVEKNVIDSTPIISELSKMKSFLKSEKLEENYNLWDQRFKIIRNEQIPKITDMIIDTEYSLTQQDYKTVVFKMAKLEMEIYKVRANADELLGEIQEVTTSEERNRTIITEFKAKYRELYQKYQNSKNEFGEISNSISLQFENIAKRFEAFEITMENNDYIEVTKIIKSIDEMLKHMAIVVEEVPSIVLMATSILPKKIDDINTVYKKMVKEGYPLDYLNVTYNIDESNKKIEDIMNRTRILNLEDCLFELKVLLDYFDSLYNDFEKEKNNRDIYEDVRNKFVKKLDRIDNIVSDIFLQIDDIKNVYNLSNEDIDLINNSKNELKELRNDYNTLISHTSNNTFAYSKLSSEIEGLTIKLSNVEEKLDKGLDALGNMKEDEVRARQQLEEIKGILKESKTRLHTYNLPIIPKSYYTELNEATSAIREIVSELDKKPITISVLNTRVDTARDLVLKLYTKTREMLKTAMFAEMAIVYGNRYRSSEDNLNKNLTYSELLFYKGEYQKSLELTINSLNKVEPNIYNKLLKFYEK